MDFKLEDILNSKMCGEISHVDLQMKNLLLLDILKIGELFEDLNNEQFKTYYEYVNIERGNLYHSLYLENKIQYFLLMGIIKTILERAEKHYLFFDDNVVCIEEVNGLEYIKLVTKRVYNVHKVELIELLDVKKGYMHYLNTKRNILNQDFNLV